MKICDSRSETCGELQRLHRRWWWQFDGRRGGTEEKFLKLYYIYILTIIIVLARLHATGLGEGAEGGGNAGGITAAKDRSGGRVPG